MNLVIDGDMVLHRALYAKTLLTMKTRDGIHTGVVYAAIKSIGSYLNALSTYRPERIFFLLGGGKSKRVQLYPEYKFKTEKEQSVWNEKIEGLDKSNSELYSEQKLLVPEILEHMGVHVLSCPSYEADDLAFLFARTFDVSNQPTILISDDGDWSQMVSKTISLFRPTVQSFVTAENFVETFEIPVESMVCFLAMLGGHDNIKKPLSGFGEKSIKKMINVLNSYTVQDVIDYGKNQKPDTVPHKLCNPEVVKQLELNYKLVDLSELEYTREPKVLVSNAIQRTHQFNHQNVEQYFRKYEFNSLTPILTHPVLRALH